MDAPPIGNNGVAFCLLADPVSSSTFRFRNVTADPELLEIHHRFIAVVALVGNQFRQPVFGNLCGRLRSLGQLLHLLGDCDQRLLNRGRVASICVLQGQCQHGSSFHIDGMLGLVR